MKNWKERLCGQNIQDGEELPSIETLLTSNDILTHGGGFFPMTHNEANMKTFRDNCILPTKQYSVLVFNEEGHPVIYSEDEEVGQPDQSDV